MKTFNLIIVTVFAAVFMISGIHAQQQKKKTIAVLNFVNSGGVDKNEISILTDRFNNFLVNTEVFDVLEREKMDMILKEQDFTMTDNCNSSECAVQVGQLLGVEYMIAGKIGKFGSVYTLDIRMIDVSTGKILGTKSENYEGRKEGLLDMIEGMAYTISGKTAPVKKTTTTTGGSSAKTGTVTGKTTTDDDGDEIKIGTVTKKYGSLEINCEMDGTLYINDKQIGEVTEGSIIPIEKLKVGSHSVKIVNADGEFTETVNIEFNRKTSITAKSKGKNKEILSGQDNEMVFIQGGTFEMGDVWGDGDEDERPVHTVTVSDFYMSKYEVTQKLWKEVMGNNPSSFSGCDDCPVENVSWNDIQEFLKKLNRKTGKNYRLPYEAEWEYAARGGGKKDYKYSGSNNADEVAWYDGNSGGKTHPVGTKKPNALGLYDMSGNVWEWCEDWYDDNYYKNSPTVNPKGPGSGTFRVLRGGSWGNNAWDIRVANRNRYSPDRRNNNYDVGFRLCVPVE